MLTSWPWPWNWKQGDENFNHGHIFWLLSGRPLLLCMYTSLDKTFPMRSWTLTLWPWPWNWKLGQKNFNLAHNSRLLNDRTFILCMCIPPDNIFQMRSWPLTSWPWHWHQKQFLQMHFIPGASVFHKHILFLFWSWCYFNQCLNVCFNMIHNRYGDIYFQICIITP